jgi:hypothetical protein
MGFYSWTVGSCDGILERRTIGRICEIDKWKEAWTCKGTNMGSCTKSAKWCFDAGWIGY